MSTLLKLPIIRHLIAGILILAIGFITGNNIFQKRLSEAKKQTQLISGKYTELENQYEKLSIRTDTLQKAIISLAKKEHIKVDNHISNPKVKRGSELNFVPNNTREQKKIERRKGKDKKGIITDFLRGIFTHK